MSRQSKAYFDQDPIPGQIINEKGVFFIGYINSWKNILKIVDNQMAHDGLIDFFNTILGGILYVPSLAELNIPCVLEKK